MTHVHRIRTCLWFDGQAEDAANFYTSIFKHSKLGNITRYGEAGAQVSGRPSGSVMTVTFELDGQDFMALNGGPEFTFNESVSFIVNCDTQEEVDYYWEKLSAGGQEVQCGWLKDKFGVSWQVVPTVLEQLMGDGTPEQTNRVMKAILGMVKLDIKRLQQAYAGS